jgi:hypothetical protein
LLTKTRYFQFSDENRPFLPRNPLQPRPSGLLPPILEKANS